MHEILASRTPTDTRSDVPKGGRGPGVYDKAYRGKADSEGWSLAFEVYAPAVVAHYIAGPALSDGVDLYKGTTGLLGRPTGSTEAPTLIQPSDVRAAIRTALSALPEVPGSARPYRDLALLMNNASEATVDRYLDLVARAVRLGIPKWRTPDSTIPRRPGRSRADRAKAQRARERAAEVASAREWLLLALDDDEDPLRPGERHEAPRLYEMATAAFEDLAGDPLDDDVDDGLLWRVPGPRAFYAVADHVLGTRQRSSKAHFYVIPEYANRAPYEENTMDNIAEQVLDRVIETLADEVIAEHGDDVRDRVRDLMSSGDHLGALTLQRERIAATGTDGVVVNLDTARARRVAR